MSSDFISHAVIKVSQTLAPWKACWPDEHNQIELSILNNGSGFRSLQRSLQAPINAQISFGLGRTSRSDCYHPRGMRAAWPLSCVPVCAILITQEDLLEIATYQPVNHARCVYLRPPFSFLCFFEGVGPAPRDF